MIAVEELGQIELFAGLSDEQLATLYGIAHEVIYPEGATLFHEGGLATRVFFLLRGSVVVWVGLRTEGDTVNVAKLDRFGDLIGWSGLAPTYGYTATATTLQDTAILCMKVDELLAALEQDPAMGYTVMRRLSGIISRRMQNIQSVILKTLERE